MNTINPVDAGVNQNFKDITNKIQEHWKKIIPPKEYHDWLSLLRPILYYKQQNIIILTVGHPHESLFYKDWFIRHYATLIQETIDEIGKRKGVRFRILNPKE